jgi:hypothetical protein
MASTTADRTGAEVGTLESTAAGTTAAASLGVAPSELKTEKTVLATEADGEDAGDDGGAVRKSVRGARP